MKASGIIKSVCLALAAVLTCATVASCGVADTAAAEDLTYISLRINPEIELVADGKDKVVAANAINEDGEVVLADLELVGDTVEEAGEKFTDKAVELGYIDTDSEDATVNIGVEGDDAEVCEKMHKKLSERINKYFENKGIYGKVCEETYEKYAEKADEWNVSVGHAKMIMRILDMYPEMTAEQVLALTVEERIALVRDNNKKNGICAGLRDEYKTKVEELKTKFAEKFDLEDEIEELEAKLREASLTEEEKAEIKAKLAEAQEKLKPLQEQFKEEFDVLKDEFRGKATEIKDKIKEEYQNRKESVKEKLKAHEEKIKQGKDDIMNKIREWRKGREG